MKTYKELRNAIYILRVEEIGPLKIGTQNFKKNPYTCAKSSLLIELSVILTYFLIRTRVTPNTVTITYGILGLLGGILLTTTNKHLITLGLVIFFFKAVLDWSDGPLARETGQTSLTGQVLDPYGSHLGDLGFQLGIGFYVASYNNIFFYLIPLIPLFYAAKLKGFAEALVFRLLTDQKIKLKSNDSTDQKAISFKDKYAGLGKFKNLYYMFNSILDDRARTVDTISLVVILELFFSFPKITWIIFLLMVLKSFILFSVNFLVVARGGWIESRVEKN